MVQTTVVRYLVHTICIYFVSLAIKQYQEPIHDIYYTLVYTFSSSFSFFLIPFIIFALLLSLPPSLNSDPGSHSRLFSPLPTTVCALHFIARRFQLFLPSSTRVELCLPTLGALSSRSFFLIHPKKEKRTNQTQNKKQKTKMYEGGQKALFSTAAVVIIRIHAVSYTHLTLPTILLV